MKFISALFLSLVMTVYANAQDLVKIQKVSEDLQNCSVIIEGTKSRGSGIIVKRGDDFFVISNWHVVAKNKITKEETFVGGVKKTTIHYDPIKVAQITIKEGRTIGKLESECDLITYSDNVTGNDLIILRVKNRDIFNLKNNANFYVGDPIPFVGMPIYHVGSFLGEDGYNSMSSGIISQLGRIIDGKIFDQVSTTNFPGSSGGGVYTTDGQCIGVLTRRTGETYGYINPIREVMKWAVNNKVEWVFDSRKPVPKYDEVSLILNQTVPIKTVIGDPKDKESELFNSFLENILKNSMPPIVK